MYVVFFFFFVSWDSHYHCCPRCHPAHETHVMNNGVLFLHLSLFLFHPLSLFPLHPSFPLMLPLFLNLPAAASIWVGPFRVSGWDGTQSMLWLCVVRISRMQLVLILSSTIHSDFLQTLPLCPLPQCLLFKVTQGKLGQRIQWSRRDKVSLLQKPDSAPCPCHPPRPVSAPTFVRLNFRASSALAQSRCARDHT